MENSRSCFVVAIWSVVMHSVELTVGVLHVSM